MASRTKKLVEKYGNDDHRVSPSGVVRLDDRMEEIAKRYDKYASRPDFPEMMVAAKAIEGQVADSINIEIELIMNNESAAKHRDKLLNHTIKT